MSKRGRRLCTLLLLVALCLTLCACGAGEDISTVLPQEEEVPTPAASPTDSSAPTAPIETAVPATAPPGTAASAAATARPDSSAPAASTASTAPAAPPVPAASPTLEPSPEPTPVPTEKQIVTVTVVAGGETMVNTTVDASQCETAYDALKAACDGAGVALDVSGSGSSVYVRGIGGLKELDQGPGSGWLYFINGTSPNKSCGAYAVFPGDTVRFAYTLNFGKDLQ